MSIKNNIITKKMCNNLLQDEVERYLCRTQVFFEGTSNKWGRKSYETSVYWQYCHITENYCWYSITIKFTNSGHQYVFPALYM